MKAIESQIQAVAAASNVPVLIQGENGTGKEVLARLIHELSAAPAGPFEKISCPAISYQSFEAELHSKKSFTDAKASEAGRMPLAHRRTLFLDEITELDPISQTKLFSFLEATSEASVDVRVISASSRNLEAEVAANKFRRDLFYRINVISLHLPPLRERKADLPALVEHFISLYNTEFNCSARKASSGFVRLLEQYHWPGNIRQLENLIKKCVLLDSEEAVSLDLIGNEQVCPEYGRLPEIPLPDSIPLKRITKDLVRDFERRIIMQVLRAHNGTLFGLLGRWGSAVGGSITSFKSLRRITSRPPHPQV